MTARAWCNDPSPPRAHRPVAAVRNFLAKLVGWVLFGLAWAFTATFRFLRRHVGRGMVAIGNVVMRPYDLAAAGYGRLLPRALQRPGLVLGSAAAAFALGLVLFLVTLGLNVLALHIVKKYREQYD